MRSKFFLFVVLLLVGAGEVWAQAAPEASTGNAGQATQAVQGRKKRIAILDFDYATVHSDVAEIFGQDVDVGKGISDLLVTDLVKNGTYSVIERKAIDKVLAEQNFSNSDRANPNTAAKLGRLLGVDAIIVGSITEFGRETKNIGGGGSGGGWVGWGLGHIRNKKSKAIVAIDARIVNVNTGEILAVAEGKGESQRESTSLLGGGGNWHGFGSGDVNFGSSDFQQTIIGEAVKQAVDNMSTELIADNPKVQIQAVVVKGLVAAVDQGQVILDVGTKVGVKVGDRFSIERVTRVIRDPATGKIIRRMTSNLGVVQVINVDALSAVAKVISGSASDFKVGDEAKTATQ